ncbi:hypothetical protein [Ornithobacterium rhinotracheale]|uniref:hypothetical protein n=1 Tax=Ornithobacterium rhinotracheale TaxID=28251 RepID=UPI001FF56298|nr:hypothetical protein [Ornithobacterium rhinotracheale]MCK0199903.1 hypothetical protein [Ornithobacterium rhinotracheale]
MKRILSLLVFLSFVCGYAQTSEEYFVSSANLFLQNKNSEALSRVTEGLEKFPDSKKLQALKQKLEQQQKDDKEQQENPDKDQQQKKDNPEKDKGDQKGENNGEQGKGQNDQMPQAPEQEEKPNGSPQDFLEKERQANRLKVLQEQEKMTKRRMMMGESRAKAGRKSKDW